MSYSCFSLESCHLYQYFLGNTEVLLYQGVYVTVGIKYVADLCKLFRPGGAVVASTRGSCWCVFFALIHKVTLYGQTLANQSRR